MRTHREQGFTLIELMIVGVIIAILGTLVALTYGGVQSKNRNSKRQTNINSIQSQMETYYALYSKYPTLNNLNDSAWRTKNLKDFDAHNLQDPSWSKLSRVCNVHDKPVLVGSPQPNCYSYQVTSTDGSACDNVKINCAQYTLTAVLEGGGKYVKSSLN